MSQLIDMLNRVARTAPAPMGFRATRAATAKSQMLLIASLVQPESLTGLSGHISGADAVLLHVAGNLEVKAVQKITRSLDIPWGGWLKDVEPKSVDMIVGAGGDFVVFPPDSPVSAVPRDSETGKVLQVEPSQSEGLLRAAADLPVDAVLITDDAKGEGPLTWQRLMVLQRTASLLSKPLLVAAPPGLSADELKLLWDTGVDGVVIEVSQEQPADRLKELRRAAGGLTNSAQRKRGKTAALVPSLRMEVPPEIEEEEE